MNRNRKRFAQLMGKMDAKFWMVHNYKTMGIEKILKLCWWFNFIYVVGGFILIFDFAIKPLFSGGREVPFICWHPQENPTPFYEILYAVQVCILFNILVTVGGFDVFYNAINIGIYVQFKLLRDRLENMVSDDEKLIKFKLKECIEHHQFLLEYCTYSIDYFLLHFVFSCSNEVLEIFSVFLLNQYVVSIITICAELYGLTET